MIGVSNEYDEALRKAQSWVGRNGIVGVSDGQKDGEPCILVHISSETPGVERLPSQVDGVPVYIELPGGPIEAQDPS